MAITTDPADGFVQLAALLRVCDSAVAFTGAGVSTEAGIPDFRSPDSAWKRNRPVAFADFMADASHRAKSWRRKFAMDDIYSGAQPARGHLALARLVHSQKVDAVITQNIDGLHQAAGLDEDRVIELHGNGTYARCLSCASATTLRRSALHSSGRALRRNVPAGASSRAQRSRSDRRCRRSPCDRRESCR